MSKFKSWITNYKKQNMKINNIALALTTILLLVKIELHAQEVYSYNLIDNGSNSYTIRAIPNANLKNLNTAMHSYGFTVIVPDGVKASVVSSIGNRASTTFFDGAAVGNSTIDGYLITQKFESTILLPSTSGKGMIDIATIEFKGGKTSKEIYILNNNSELAREVTALKSFLTADITDNDISKFSNVVSSESTEDFKKPTSVSSVISSEKNALAPFAIYPNPTKDVFHIALSNSNVDITSLKLYNIHGALVKLKNTAVSNKVDISNLSHGVYFIKIETSMGNTYTRKIIKQ